MLEQYQFGHTDLAAERLRIVAEVFRDSSADFLRVAAPEAPLIAVDLGCGPGMTTQLLRDVTRPRRSIGLDLSQAFLDVARRAVPDAEFLPHDVTAIPFPTPPADLGFCRYVLAHLREPERRIADWMTQLAPGGRLLVEEVEAIDARRPTFAFYLETVAAMLVSQGTELYLGPRLAAMTDPPGTRRVHDRVTRLRVTNRDAARMFATNIPNWRERPFIRETRTPEQLDELRADFDRERLREDETSEIMWRLRRIAWETKPEGVP